MTLCRIVERTSEMAAVALKELRFGYPELPYEEQCRGRRFRALSHVITGVIATTTVRVALQRTERERLVVMMPWRAGLAFAAAYRSLGVTRFYHISSKRDEHTLETHVDYEGGCAIDRDDTIIAADPMLATGNTTCDAVGRMITKGVRPEDIIVNAVIAAPEGVARVYERLPNARVIVGALDEELDARGYIKPGCGDYGDKYFDGMTREEKISLAASFNADPETELRLVARLCAS